MLNWLVSYLNYNGYDFSDNNYDYDNNYYNYNNFEYDYAVNYSQQSCAAAPSRRQRNRRRRNKAAISSTNQNRDKQLDVEKRQALEADNLKKGLETKIEVGNKGYEMLVKMGYENGKGLGRNAEGMLEPLKLETKCDRKGLGANEAKTTTATTILQKLSRKQRRRLRRKERAEQAAQQQQPKKAVTQQPAAVKRVGIATPLTVQKTKSNTEIVKMVVAPMPQVNKSTITSKEAVKKSPAKVVTTTPIQKVIAINTNKTGKTKFSTKEPCTPEFMKSLSRAFNSEIELMQLRLAAEASLNQPPSDNELIVVKIYIDNNPNVADHVFEFIRTELVGWIGAYQQDGLDTPIFHSITNNLSHITIVCDNIYAFQCLERCIKEIVQMKTMDSLKILRLPPITPMIYCFDAKYEGIASDADLFLLQLHLHKPKLYTTNWVVASQEVCADERRTYFIFLIDERSALALNFHYNRSFFICMQQVTFRNRGIVRETILN
ncbi:uncharacterized protein ACRADG_007126 [Cochliomyia hominivorax]